MLAAGEAGTGHSGEVFTRCVLAEKRRVPSPPGEWLRGFVVRDHLGASEQKAELWETGSSEREAGPVGVCLQLIFPFEDFHVCRQIAKAA